MVRVGTQQASLTLNQMSLRIRSPLYPINLREKIIQYLNLIVKQIPRLRHERTLLVGHSGPTVVPHIVSWQRVNHIIPMHIHASVEAHRATTAIALYVSTIRSVVVVISQHTVQHVQRIFIRAENHIVGNSRRAIRIKILLLAACSPEQNERHGQQQQPILLHDLFSSKS